MHNSLVKTNLLLPVNIADILVIKKMSTCIILKLVPKKKKNLMWLSHNFFLLSIAVENNFKQVNH